MKHNRLLPLVLVVLLASAMVPAPAAAEHPPPDVLIVSSAPSPGGIHVTALPGIQNNRVYTPFDLYIGGQANQTWEVWVGNHIYANGTTPNGSPAIHVNTSENASTPYPIWRMHIEVTIDEGVRRTPIWVVIGNETWDFGAVRVERTSLRIYDENGGLADFFLELTPNEFAQAQWQAFWGVMYVVFPGFPMMAALIWRLKSRRVTTDIVGRSL